MQKYSNRWEELAATDPKVLEPISCEICGQRSEPLYADENVVSCENCLRNEEAFNQDDDCPVGPAEIAEFNRSVK